MTQEEKRNKRNEKKEKKKDRVEAAKNKDKLNNIVPPTASSSTSVASSEIIHTNGFSVRFLQIFTLNANYRKSRHLVMRGESSV